MSTTSSSPPRSKSAHVMILARALVRTTHPYKVCFQCACATIYKKSVIENKTNQWFAAACLYKQRPSRLWFRAMVLYLCVSVLERTTFVVIQAVRITCFYNVPVQQYSKKEVIHSRTNQCFAATCGLFFKKNHCSLTQGEGLGVLRPCCRKQSHLVWSQKSKLPFV